MNVVFFVVDCLGGKGNCSLIRGGGECYGGSALLCL